MFAFGQEHRIQLQHKRTVELIGNAAAAPQPDIAPEYAWPKASFLDYAQSGLILLTITGEESY